MAWTAFAFLILALGLGAATIHVGGSARAPDDQMRALLLAVGSLTSLVAAIVCAVLAAIG